MHSCIELYLLGRERVSETMRQAAAPWVLAGATLVLEMGEVISVRLSGRPFRVACVAGRLWATVDGDAEDHLLLPGEARTFRGRGTVVVQALRTTTALVDSNL
jgi:hypothetical protein